MAKQMPLLAELSNCLSAYKETLERILNCILHTCDVNHKKHDTPVILQVQDLLSIDAELQRHLNRMKEWTKRQKKIDEYEKKLAVLSNRVNDFARSLSIAQTSLQGSLSTAANFQRSAENQEFATIDTILESAKNISKHTSGAPAHENEIPWHPHYTIISQSSFYKNTLKLEAPKIESKSTDIGNLEFSREANLQREEEDGDYDEVEDDD